MDAPEEFTAVSAENHLGKTVLAGVTAALAVLRGMDQPPACKLLLHQQEDVLWDDRLMIALDVVLWDGTVVLDPLLGQEIRGVGLLQERIRKVLAVMSDGKTGTPCGACRELMVQLMPTT